MKKFLPLVLALLMLLSLVACGEKTPAASNEKNEDTQQSEQTTTDPGSEAQTDKPDEQSKASSFASASEWYAAKGLNLPANVQIMAGEEGNVGSITIEKIGDDFMMIAMGGLGCEFYTFKDGSWQHYKKLGAEDWTQESGNELEEILYLWSEKATGAVKSGDTKEIAGHNCVGYNITDSFSGQTVTYYADENIGMYFEEVRNGERYDGIYGWDETISAFQVEPPTK